jgi:hypothetical protein
MWAAPPPWWWSEFAGRIAIRTWSRKGAVVCLISGWELASILLFGFHFAALPLGVPDLCQGIIGSEGSPMRATLGAEHLTS